MVALGPQCFYWGLGQISIAFQGFMKYLFFLSSSLKAMNRFDFRAAIKCLSLFRMSRKFPSAENQWSIRTKRNFKMLQAQVSIIFRISSFLVISLLRLTCRISMSQNCNGFLNNSKATGTEAPSL